MFVPLATKKPNPTNTKIDVKFVGFFVNTNLIS